MNTDYDALLVVSFGGPEGMDDVIPFLENVLRGRNVPRERMLRWRVITKCSAASVRSISRIANLIAALEKELEQNGPRLPIYWGNRNWHPLLARHVAQMAADGIRNALAFVTSAYSSYSSCRQYLAKHQRRAERRLDQRRRASRSCGRFTIIRCLSKRTSITFARR